MNDGTNANKMNLKPWDMAKFETVAQSYGTEFFSLHKA